ncbi:MAG TPA: signal peptidase II [Chloroflexota bacterium]
MKRPPLVDRLFFATAVGVFVLDQLTKSWIAATLGPGGGRPSIELVGDYARLVYTTNTGAAFGIGQNRSLVFTIVALVAIPAITLFNRSIAPRSLLTRLCLGALLGGTLGNLLDRLRLGYVIDFVDVGVGDLRWPSFNLADSSFVVGILILSIYLFLTDPTRGREREAADRPDQRYA